MPELAELADELAALIRGRRLARRLTQREAAKRAGVSLATWQALERPITLPCNFQDLTLACAAHGLGLDLAEVFSAAGRPIPTDGLVPHHRASTVVTTVDVSAMINHIEDMLTALAAISPTDAVFVYEHTVDLARHMTGTRERTSA